MLIAEALSGRTVLLVHHEPFQAAYLASVIRAAGATLLGPAFTTADGSELLATVVGIDAIVLEAPRGAGRLPASIEVAARLGTTVPIVHVGRLNTADRGETNGVRAPFAGFQVVQSLVALLGGAPVSPVVPGERMKISTCALRMSSTPVSADHPHGAMGAGR